MKTMIDIDDSVLADAQRALGTKTKRETVDAALRRVAYGGQQRRVIDLFAEDPQLAQGLLDVVEERHRA
jgi:Arc/MetJ family transcription regulator